MTVGRAGLWPNPRQTALKRPERASVTVRRAGRGRLVLLGLLIALAGLTASSPSAAQPVPPDSLTNQIQRLREHARFIEADSLARKLLAQREANPATRPCDLLDAQLLVKTMELVSHLSRRAQKELAWADSIDFTIEALQNVGPAAEEDSLAGRQLEIRRRYLGPEHPDIAASLDNLAVAHGDLGDYDGGVRLDREALAMRRAVYGMDHPDVVQGLMDLAELLKVDGKYPEAVARGREAVAMARRLLEPGDPEIATVLEGLANVLDEDGQFKAAASTYREALALRRHAYGEENPLVAESLSGLANVLEEESDYASAEPLLRQALAMRRRFNGKQSDTVAETENDLGFLYLDQHDYADAASLYRDALAILRKVYGDDHPQVARVKINLALALDGEGDTAGADSLFRQAADASRARGGDHIEEPAALNGLAGILRKQRDLEDAERLYREALRIETAVYGGEHPSIATTRQGLAQVMEARGDSAGAEREMRDVLAMRQKGEGTDHPDVIESLGDLARLLRSEGRFTEADTALSQGAALYEAARTRAGSGLDRATFENSPYPLLAETRLRLGDVNDAWPAVEQDLGRVLFELMTASGQRRLTPDEAAEEDSLKRERDRLDGALAAFRRVAPADSGAAVVRRAEETRTRLLGVEAEWSSFENRMAREHPVEEGQAFPLARVQSALDARSAILGWLDVQIRSREWDVWGYVIRSTGPVAWVRLSQPLAADSLGPEELPLRFRQELEGAASWPGLAPPSTGEMEEARQVFAARIAPLLPYLEGAQTLFVVPSGAMLGVPVDALRDDSGVPLSDRYTISYVPSATIFAWLRTGQETRNRPEEPALLIGDPAGPALLAQRKPESDNAASDLTVPAPLAAMESPGAAHGGREILRGALAGDDSALDALPSLPATRDEIAAIAASLPGSTVLLGTAASEQALDSLAESGELRRFRTIHLATHALTDDERPERSALVLSRANLPDPLAAAMAGRKVYDGLLTAGAILRDWKLDADLVTLSGCETGIGRPVGGEGYIGLAHALLQVGARSVVVSLWKVNDRATALLMGRFYQNLVSDDPERGGRGSAFRRAAALREAKNWLRRYRERPWKKPPYESAAYWSAFVLVGDPG